MKVGDKVVCLHPTMFRYYDHVFKDVSDKLELNKVYTIEFYIKNTIGVENVNSRFTPLRFISLKEYRKQKLDKICLESEIN